MLRQELREGYKHYVKCMACCEQWRDSAFDVAVSAVVYVVVALQHSSTVTLVCGCRLCVNKHECEWVTRFLTAKLLRDRMSELK